MSSQSQVDPDQFYIDVPITFNQGMGNGPTPASVTVTRQQPIINNIEDFYMSCVRLTYSAFNVPLMIAPLKVDSPYSSGLCIYSFTMKYKTFTSGQIFVPWISTDLSGSIGYTNSLNIPPVDIGNVKTSLQSYNPYYWLFTFQDICSMLSNAISLAFNALNTASGGLPSGSKPPVVYWDGQRGSTLIQAQIANYDPNTAGSNLITLYCNNELETLFNNYPTVNYGANQPQGADTLINLHLDFHNKDTIDDTLFNTYPFSFDPSYFVSVDKFQVKTTIPVVYEGIIPANFNYGSSNNSQNSSQNPSSNILIDLAPDWGSITSVASIFIYNKVDNWRFASMAGSGPLSVLGLDLYFVTYSGVGAAIY